MPPTKIKKELKLLSIKEMIMKFYTPKNFALKQNIENRRKLLPRKISWVVSPRCKLVMTWPLGQ